MNRWECHATTFTTKSVSQYVSGTKEVEFTSSENIYIYQNWELNQSTGIFTLTSPKLLNGRIADSFNAYGVIDNLSNNLNDYQYFSENNPSSSFSGRYVINLKGWSNSYANMIGGQNTKSGYTAEASSTPGELLGYVYSKDSTAYPANGSQGSYYYINNTPSLPELWPVS